MPLRVVTRIIEVFVCCDVFVDVIHFDLTQKAVRVCVKKLGPWAVLFFQLVGEKVIHQDLAVVKDRHPSVNGFVQQQLAFAHVDPNHVF